jgi:Fe-S cluster assembly protein SufD
MTTASHGILPLTGPASITELVGRADEVFAGDPAWLRDLRADALKRFDACGLPRRTDEEWRYTSVKPIVETSYQIGGEAASLSAIDLDRAAVAVPDAFRLVFIDGILAPELSTSERPPAGVAVLPLDQAIERRPEVLEPVLMDSLAAARDGFELLSGGLMSSGALVHVGPNKRIERPIVITHVRTGQGAPRLVTPRVVVVAEAGAEVKVVEDYASIGAPEGLTNGFTDVVVGANARVEHFLLEREGEAAFHVSTLRARQHRDSYLASHRMILGGRIVRNNVVPILDGENGHSLLNGLFVGHGSQHIDNHMRVEHQLPNCESRQYYRGLLDDRAKGVFTGRIVVAEDAQKTDAIQSNDNILLGPMAQVWTKPQLEIYADDVRCTHGATTARIDEDAMFYLRARGLTPEQARLMLLFAFAGETLDRLTIPVVRERIRAEVAERLAGRAPQHEVD